MAFRFEKNSESNSLDLVFDGFEKGIADSAEKGIADMKGMNIISIPGEASVNFATSAIKVPPVVTSANATYVGATDVVTCSTAVGIYDGCAVSFSSSGDNITAGTTYWAGSVSGTTFKLYTNIARNNVVNISGDGSNTMTTYQLGQATYYTLDRTPHGASGQSGYVMFLDANGRAWWVNDSGNLVFMGNTTLTNAHGNGICVLRDWVFIFRDTNIDYLPTDALTNSTDTFGQWVFGWQSSLTSSTIHQAISATDNAMYICNGRLVASILIAAGSSFDPSSSGTYSFSTTAVTLPYGESTTYLAELGTAVLIGTITNKLYSWNRLDTLANYPLILAEENVHAIVSANSNSYVFAGNRGRIYITNGSGVQLYKKIPDQLSTVPDPYFVWGGAIYWKNQLYFGVYAYNNANTALTATGGVWAIDLETDALRQTNILSVGLAGITPVIAPNITTSTPGGSGFFAPWYTSNPSYGIDITTTTPNTVSNNSYMDLDLVPVGTFLTKKTFSQIEFKLSRQLASGESIQIQQRPDLSTAFASITNGTFSTSGAISGVIPVDFQAYQYLQLRVIPTSTASSPSYVRVTEIRIR